MADERIELLEFKVAHLEQAVQELSDVLYRQQREIAALRARAQQLFDQLQHLETRGGDPGRIELPPHY